MTTSLTKKNNKFQWVPISELSVIHPDAQRPLNERNAARIARDFDPDLFGVITIAEMTGVDGGGKSYHIIDGQTRIEAMRLMGWHDQSAPCLIRSTSAKADAARMFDGIHSRAQRPGAIDLFLVRVTAGNEVETDVARIITSHGYQIGRARDGNIASVTACVTVYNRFGSAVFSDTLDVIVGAWGHHREGVHASIVGGIGQLLDHSHDIGKARLIDRLTKSGTAGSMIGHARTIKEARGGTLAHNVSWVAADRYNVGLRSGKIKWD